MLIIKFVLSGNIILFAFDNDGFLTGHAAPFEANVHMVDSKTEITINGKPYNVRMRFYYQQSSRFINP